MQTYQHLRGTQPWEPRLVSSSATLTEHLTPRHVSCESFAMEQTYIASRVLLETVKLVLEGARSSRVSSGAHPSEGRPGGRLRDKDRTGV